jgi:hypothetical protein
VAASLTKFKLTVFFHTERIGTGEDPIEIEGPFDPPDSKNLRVPQGIGLIVFEVVTLPLGSTPEAQFPTYPIEWFTNNGGEFNTPIAQPESFEVRWYNPRQCTVIDTNTALFENSHPFNVVVAYKNNTYGSDPTIINEPEDG